MPVILIRRSRSRQRRDGWNTYLHRNRRREFSMSGYISAVLWALSNQHQRPTYQRTPVMYRERESGPPGPIGPFLCHVNAARCIGAKTCWVNCYEKEGRSFVQRPRSDSNRQVTVLTAFHYHDVSRTRSFVMIQTTRTTCAQLGNLDRIGFIRILEEESKRHTDKLLTCGGASTRPALCLKGRDTGPLVYSWPVS